MGGRVTSRDSGLNEYGVPYSKILDLERETNRRHTRALTEALQHWLLVEEARRNNERQAAERLCREALELTEKALR